MSEAQKRIEPEAPSSGASEELYLGDAIHFFLSAKRAGGRSARTVDDYRKKLELFQRWVARRVGGEDAVDAPYSWIGADEVEATYQEIFRSLKRRGLSGVELVVSDDHEGLKAALARHFQGATHQRCQVHYSRNLLGMVGHARRKELSEGLRGVFAATSREMALGLASELAARWRASHPGVAEHLEEHIEECLACLAFPEPHRRRIRTTNGLKRFNQEIKRRTRVVRIFPNREASLRLVTALAVEQSEEWLTGRRYLDMRELEEHRRQEREAEEAMLMEH